MADDIVGLDLKLIMDIMLVLWISFDRMTEGTTVTGIYFNGMDWDITLLATGNYSLPVKTTSSHPIRPEERKRAGICRFEALQGPVPIMIY